MKTIVRCFVGGLLAAGSLSASAAGVTYTWTGTTNDSLRTAGKYTIGGTLTTAIPGAGDLVVIPARSSYLVDDGTAALVSSYKSIKVETSAFVCFAINDACSIDCIVSGMGTVYKKGEGTLTLTSDRQVVEDGYCYDYDTNWIVEEGVVAELPTGGTSGTYYYFQSICVKRGAEFKLPYGDDCHALFRSGFFGAGTISHKAKTAGNVSYLRVSAGSIENVFDGYLTGDVQLYKIYGALALTNTKNDFVGGLYCLCGGTLGFSGNVPKRSTVPTSLGLLDSGRSYAYNTSRFVNLTDGEAAEFAQDYYYRIDSGESMSLSIDGGSYGALTWSSETKIDFNDVGVVYLDGNHLNPCTFKSKMTPNTGKLGWITFVKRGSGKWKMNTSVSNDNMTRTSGVVIENGSLCLLDRFRPIGYVRSVLGPGDFPFYGYDYAGPSNVAPPAVDYSIRLGNPKDLTQTGVLELATTYNSTEATNRCLGITGNGGVKLSSSGTLYVFGAKTVVPADGTDVPPFNSLTLETNPDVGYAPRLQDVTEDAGPLRIVKKGNGLPWELRGKLEFTGGIDVQGGSVLIYNNTSSSVLPSGLSYVRVATNAALSVKGNAIVAKGLAVDVSGAGALTNVTLAATGTLAIENIGAEWPTFIPVGFAGCDGWSNLQNWSVTVNGEPIGKRYFVIINDEGIKVSKGGFMLILR